MRYSEGIKTRSTARHMVCVKLSDDVNTKVLLDIGCWIGWYEKFMVEKGCDFIVGMDMDHHALCKAKKNVSNNRCEFVCGSANALPFKRESFDAVSLFDVLEHLPQGSEFSFFSEASGVLKANGTVIVSTPNNCFVSNLLDPAYFLIGHRHYAVNEIREMMENLDLDVYKIEYGGGIVELSSMILMYLFKHLFGMEIPFKSFLDYLRNKEYQGKGFATLFVKAAKTK